MDSSAATPTTKHLDSSRASPYSSVPSMGSSQANTGTKRINSRRKTRTILPRVTCTVASSSEFIQPSKLFPSGKQHITPYSVRSSDLTRRQQLQHSAPKIEPAKGAVRRDNQPKPYTLDPPPQAQKYPDAGCSDFFPWRGNHNEDRVTDAQARNGQYDKLPVGKSNNEQASARAVIAPTLKQRPGLSTLSSLFLSILEQRQNSGQMPSASTFKPPPRIALPDPRREAWLRDLASVHVPLRRLSRTIPHGLKGTVLLEHCLAKEVPVPRAVWLIRCVGANELRGLRRKGVGSLAVGGEARWIREWTVQVSQFLEKILFGSSLPAGGPWHHHIIYTIRLVLHLHAENLLDGSVFLDWLMSLAQECSSERLPLVFAVITPLWEDIMKQRKLVSRLARIMYFHLSQQCISLCEPLTGVCHRYWAQSTELPNNHRRGLIGEAPAISMAISQTILVDVSDSRLRKCAENISYRTTSIGAEKTLSIVDDRQESHCRKLLASLDKNAPPYDFKSFWKDYAVILAQPSGIHRLCQWAVTPLRSGTYRVYVAVRLLKSVAQSGVDLQEPFLAFLEQCDCPNNALYLLVSEVARMRIFSIAGYLRWLIASGGLRNPTSAHAQILSQLPTHAVSTRLQNLRRILLRSCGKDVDSESRIAVDTKDFLVKRGIFTEAPTTIVPLDVKEIEHLKGLSRSIQSEIGLWIRDTIRNRIRGPTVQDPKWSSLSTDQSPYIEPQQFMLARQVLEAFCDMIMLADVIKYIVLSDGCEILKSAIDTMVNNADAFYVLDVLPEAVDIAYERYSVLRSRHCLDKPLIIAFSELAAITSTPKILHELSSDLATYDRDYPRSAAAPSPVSEPMGDMFDDDGIDNNDEIERLWNSNVPVERHNLSRLFETAASSIENSLDSNDAQGPLVSATQGLNKLRDMDSVSFDESMNRWIQKMRRFSNNVPFFRAMTLLIAGATVQLSTLVSSALLDAGAEKCPVAEDDYHFAANVLHLVLEDNPFETRLSAQELYALKTQRYTFLRNNTRLVLGLYRQLIIACASLNNNDLNCHTTELLSSQFSLDTLRCITVRTPEIFMSEIVEPLSRLNTHRPGTIRWLLILVDHILDDHDPSVTTEDSIYAAQVGRLLTIVDDFNLNICKLKLQLVFSIYSGDMAVRSNHVEHSPRAIAKAVVRGFVSAPHTRHHLCSDLVSLLTPDHARDICSTAEDLVLDPTSFLQVRHVLEKLGLPPADGAEVSGHIAKVLLCIIESTSSSTRNFEPQEVPSLLVDRLSTLLQKLDENGDAQSDGWAYETDAEFCSWLLLVLRILVVHRSEFSPSRSTTAAYDQARIVFCLCCLLQTEYIRNRADISEYIFDIASQLADDLPDEPRAQLRRCALSHQHPPEMSFLVGNWENTDNLEACQRGKNSDYFVKSWERLSEPTPVIGENDTSLSLGLFRARRT